MDDDDRLCGAHGPDGMTCTRPPHAHGEQHAFEVMLPPHVAKIVEAQIRRLEEARERHVRQAKRERTSTYINFGLMAVWVALILSRLAGLI